VISVHRVAQTRADLGPRRPREPCRFPLRGSLRSRRLHFRGLYYGEDPDFWPVFLTHGPAGGGAVSVWDFTDAVKFWQDGKHPNRGFFLHGDVND
jgi:hypothetical protein